MKQSESPQSGGGMDRVVAKRGPSTTVKIGLAAIGLLLLLAVFYYFAPSANSQTVPVARLTISTVSEGSTRSRAAGSSGSWSRTAPWSSRASCSRC